MYESISSPEPSGHEASISQTFGSRMPNWRSLEGTTSLTPPPQGPDDGPFRLEDIKMALVCHAYEQRFFQPLKSFFNKMVLKWGNTKTAHASRVKGVPTIVLGRKFFAENVKTPMEGAEIVMHEIMHHLFVHLILDKIFRDLGYSLMLINIAEDAIINAYLASKKMASFMRRYYPDKGYYAFLRPDSENVEVRYLLTGVPEEGADVSGRYNDPGVQFYDKLKKLGITLEASVEFFNTYFKAAQEGPEELIGSHGEPSDGDKEEGGQGKARGEGDAADAMKGDSGEEPGDGKASGDGDGPLFGRSEAEAIMRSLEIGIASKRAQNNFLSIIRTITHYANLPGASRTSKTQTRRMPVKLGQYEMVSIERGRNLFRRWDYQKRKFAIFFDVSGSVATYIPFVAGLVKSLRSAEHEVRLFLWADEVEELALHELGVKDANVGGGTQGEKVARYLASHPEITNVVLITDNCAGELNTPIKCHVHLCLFPGYESEMGSFRDTHMVPHCRVHTLQVD